jgi:cytochrome c
VRAAFTFSAVVAALAFAGAVAGQSSGGGITQAAAGAKLYQSRCATCHSPTANKIGPAHKGVFGRTAASAPGFKYSPALKASKITWNAATLDKWLSGPQKMVKGSKMFLVVANAEERAAIIAYLKTQ